MLGESIRVYTYCLLSAQSSTRSSIIGSSGPNFEAQKLFAKELEDFVKRDMLLHEDIKRYEAVLSNARSSVDFSVGKGIYMLPSDLRLKVPEKQSSFNDKLRVGHQATPGVVKQPLKQTRVIASSSTGALTLHEQRLSGEHDDELQSLVLFGSLALVGLVWFLKRK